MAERWHDKMDGAFKDVRRSLARVRGREPGG